MSISGINHANESTFALQLLDYAFNGYKDVSTLEKISKIALAVILLTPGVGAVVIASACLLDGSYVIAKMVFSLTGQLGNASAKKKEDSEAVKVVPVKAASIGPWLYSKVKTVVRYTFPNLLTIPHNLVLNGTCLTSSKVLKAPENTSLWENLKPQQINKVVSDQLSTNKTKITFIHTPISLMVPHSTMLAIVTEEKEEGRPKSTAIFFDPRGNHPKDACFKEPVEGQKNVQEFYDKIIQGVDDPPDKLIYSATSIQGDVVSCTAYSAVFMQELNKAVEERENLDRFMEKVVNSEVVTLVKARLAVQQAWSIQPQELGRRDFSDSSEFEVMD